jgi:GntR family transcriptional regulator/MocR family aminotransferase
VQELDPEVVVYLGTSSKSLAPGLRLSWMVVPDALVEPVLAVKRSTTWQTGFFEQLTFAEFLASGAYDRHVRRSRMKYRRRRDRLVAALDRHAPRVAVTGSAAGLHALLQLPDRLPDRGDADHVESAALESAAARGLAVDGLRRFRLDAGRSVPAGLVVGFGTPADHAFSQGLDVLVAVAAAL